MLSVSVSQIWTYWPFVLPCPILVYLIANKYRYGIHQYPGPWLAAFTDWWRFFDNCGRQSERTFLALHHKHGDIVRIGPNTLSFANPKAVKSIYGLNKGFVKSDFYPVQQGVVKGKRLPPLFSTVDEGFHARYRRCVNNAFSMSTLVSYEPLVERTIAFYLEKTHQIFEAPDRECNFGRWLQYFAFDVIGELTWSKRLGFVEKNEDIDGIIGFIARFLDYAGLMPFLDLFLQKNILYMLFQRLGLSRAVFPATKFALARATERNLENHAEIKDKHGDDLLSKFEQAQKEHPETMTDDLVITSCLSMVLAGSETTAITLSAVFYYLLKTPRTYTKLKTELDDAVESGNIASDEDGVISWKDSQKLPYLDAVIQEAFRMHPAAGLLLERVVPRNGVQILNERIPGRTIVGCNAWILHRRPEVFGTDVNVFRPERWLEARPETLKEMKATMFQFGRGSRTCIGKNVSLLEIYKLVPSLMRRFDVILFNPQKEWTTQNAWFVRQLDFNVRFRERMFQKKAMKHDDRIELTEPIFESIR